MNLVLRPGKPEDAKTCGTICHNAFTTISTQHNFPPDLPTADVAIGFMNWLLGDPRFYSVVAEVDGRIVGSSFLDMRTPIGGIGPVTVDPSVQNGSVGRRMMENLLHHAAKRKLAGVRLVQAAFHNRSLSLYTKLGFVVRGPPKQPG